MTATLTVDAARPSQQWVLAVPFGAMPEFRFQELLPLDHDETEFRLLTDQHVSTFDAGGQRFVKLEPEALTLLARVAMHEIAHYLRPGHLAQLRAILDDPEASANDRFVALDLLKNANISAGGILPMCQDTGTAIVMGKKGQRVFTGFDDEEAIARGVFDTYQTDNLRYSQMAPVTMWEEKNTANNLPAQIELYAVPGDTYQFLFMAKGGGSANKSYLYQQTKAVLNPTSLLAFFDDKAPHPRHGGLPALSPRHRDRRHVGRVCAEDREVRVGALPRRVADDRQRAGPRFS